MRPILMIALVAQTSGTVLAVVFNTFFIYIIFRFLHKTIGFYKYVLAAFALFQSAYAIAVFVGMPIHFIAENTWIGLNYYGPLGGTKFAILGPLTYCLFYESWLGFEVIIFTFRYICVCQHRLAETISKNTWPKVLVMILMIAYFSMCGCCAYYFCPQNKLSENLLDRIQKLFEFENKTEIAYYAVRFTDVNGNFSPMSTAAIVTHYAMIVNSVSIVSLCSINMWRVIRQVNNVRINIALERQFFKSLIIQTAIPVVLCHLPSLFAMSFPLWKSELDFWPFFSVFTTIPKAIDPIISIVCIHDFRIAALKVFGRKITPCVNNLPTFSVSTEVYIGNCKNSSSY